MSTTAQRYEKIALIAMLVIGGFVLYTPASVNAAHGAHAKTMAEMSMPENSGCLKQQKCPQRSSSCEQYCVRRSTEQTAVAATTTVHHHRFFATISAPDSSADDLVKIGRMLAMPDRSPPGHQFLRSVIKRE